MDPNARQSRLDTITNLPGLDFLTSLLPYLARRLSQTYVFLLSSIEVLVFSFNKLKSYLVHRMFWGRGSLYKSSFHIVITIFTSVLLVTGILSRVGLVTEASEQALSISYGTLGNNDLLAQGASLTTVLPLDETQYNFQVDTYRVRSGDSLSDIAKRFSVSKDTIKWANEGKLSPYNDDIKVGDTLLIPEIDGVLYQVKSGDTLASVVDLTSGNRFDIIELNNLVPPSYKLRAGSRLFIPGGEIKPPPPPTPVYVPVPVYVPPSSTGAGEALAGISFSDPLSHPSCAGYLWMRGFLPWHSGVDLAGLGGGCPIRAAASGTVISAGWSGAAGLQVAIDHGNGVTTHYWHGSSIWVSVGQKVSAGQDIMHMGSTGNSTGIHLHLELRHNNINLDPSPYIPYRRY